MIRATLPTVADATELERKVKDMYTRVALDPQGEFHFEMGRTMAHRLGYTDAELDAAPAEAVESLWPIAQSRESSRQRRASAAGECRLSSRPF